MSAPVGPRARPHLRCGICDEEFTDADATTYVDDERCHVSCASDERPDRQFFARYCPGCQRELDDDDYDAGRCTCCGEDIT